MARNRKRPAPKKRPTTNQPWRRPCVFNKDFKDAPPANAGEDLTPTEIVSQVESFEDNFITSEFDFKPTYFTLNTN